MKYNKTAKTGENPIRSRHKMYDIKSLSKKIDFKLKSLEPKLLHKTDLCLLNINV